MIELSKEEFKDLLYQAFYAGSERNWWEDHWAGGFPEEPDQFTYVNKMVDDYFPPEVDTAG
jgi:hypothetical protein